VSARKSGVLLAVLALATCAGVNELRSQTGQNQTGQNQTGQNQDAQNEVVRRAKTKVQPVYPELARKMNLTGTVKVEVVVAPNGTVKEAKVVGGHPVLAGAALDAVRKWRFEPASMESSGVVDFKFEPHE
jgi:TonB family protein